MSIHHILIWLYLPFILPWMGCSLVQLRIKYKGILIYCKHLFGFEIIGRVKMAAPPPSFPTCHFNSIYLTIHCILALRPNISPTKHFTNKHLIFFIVLVLLHERVIQLVCKRIYLVWSFITLIVLLEYFCYLRFKFMIVAIVSTSLTNIEKSG